MNPITQGNRDIATYFTDIKKLQEKHDSMLSTPTCPCGISCATYIAVHKMREREKLIQLLVSLNGVYKTLRGNMLMSRPLSKVNEAYYMLLQEEHQREMSSTAHIMPQSTALNTNFNFSNNFDQYSTAMMGNHNGYGNKNVGYGGNGSRNPGHNFGYGVVGNNTTYGKNPGSKKTLLCDYYKIAGHTVQKGCKIHGYPPGHSLHKGKKVTALVTQE